MTCGWVIGFKSLYQINEFRYGDFTIDEDIDEFFIYVMIGTMYGFHYISKVRHVLPILCTFGIRSVLQRCLKLLNASELEPMSDRQPASIHQNRARVINSFFPSTHKTIFSPITTFPTLKISSSSSGYSMDEAQIDTCFTFSM